MHAHVHKCAPLRLALGSPIFPSGCEGKLGVLLCLEGVTDLPSAPQDEAGLTRKLDLALKGPTLFLVVLELLLS